MWDPHGTLRGGGGWNLTLQVRNFPNKYRSGVKLIKSYITRKYPQLYMPMYVRLWFRRFHEPSSIQQQMKRTHLSQTPSRKQRMHSSRMRTDRCNGCQRGVSIQAPPRQRHRWTEAPPDRDPPSRQTPPSVGRSRHTPCYGQTSMSKNITFPCGRLKKTRQKDKKRKREETERLDYTKLTLP